MDEPHVPQPTMRILLDAGSMEDMIDFRLGSNLAGIVFLDVSRPSRVFKKNDVQRLDTRRSAGRDRGKIRKDGLSLTFRSDPISVQT